jgi:hypothetical protein
VSIVVKYHGFWSPRERLQDEVDLPLLSHSKVSGDDTERQAITSFCSSPKVA